MQLTIFDLEARTWKEPMAAEPKEEVQEVKEKVREPKCFEDYVGKCDFCHWQKNECNKFNCQWSSLNQDKHSYKHCDNGSFWLPNAQSIPKLCGACKYSNSFVYDGEDINHPVEEPNIYCTRDEGSLNRHKPYENKYQWGFGIGTWHRQHEWDSCDAWELDAFWGKRIENGRIVR